MIRAEDTYVAIIIGFICSLGLGLTIEIFRRTQQSHRSLLHAEDAKVVLPGKPVTRFEMSRRQRQETSIDMNGHNTDQKQQHSRWGGFPRMLRQGD